MKLRLGLDLDSTCADLFGYWLECYNQEWRDNLAVIDIKHWDVTRFVKPECGMRMLDYLQLPGFFANLDPMPHMRQVLTRLSPSFEFIVVTDRLPRHHQDTVEWVKRHMPQVKPHDIVFTGRKDLVNVDILVDDKPLHLTSTMGVPIAMSYPYNAHVKCKHVLDWEELGAALNKIAL